MRRAVERRSGTLRADRRRAALGAWTPRIGLAVGHARRWIARTARIVVTNAGRRGRPEFDAKLGQATHRPETTLPVTVDLDQRGDEQQAEEHRDHYRSDRVAIPLDREWYEHEQDLRC